ncbi:NERD domain-containing protein [Clostridiales bacterium COT073_COT-073]|nr:NERD domain-containing protein [Clostridiales bacterium COT073_COT-073]
MAQIVKKSNRLNSQIKKLYLEWLFYGGLAAVCVALLEVTQMFSFVGIQLIFLKILDSINNYRILKVGLGGEKKVFELINHLPKGYKILTDVKIVNGRKSSQIDFVIIGRNGIFIMEAKNMRGTIRGKENDKVLKKIKIGKSGDKYASDVYNPILQILGHKKGFDAFLASKGHSYRAIPILYFSGEGSIEVESEKVKIIDEPVLVIDYIKRHNQDNISDFVQNKIIEDLLEKAEK